MFTCTLTTPGPFTVKYSTGGEIPLTLDGCGPSATITLHNIELDASKIIEHDDFFADLTLSDKETCLENILNSASGSSELRSLIQTCLSALSNEEFLDEIGRSACISHFDIEEAS